MICLQAIVFKQEGSGHGNCLFPCQHIISVLCPRLANFSFVTCPPVNVWNCLRGRISPLQDASAQVFFLLLNVTSNVVARQSHNTRQVGKGDGGVVKAVLTVLYSNDG